jgi:hypothetical protein
VTKAKCPHCGKVVEVAGPSSAIAGRLVRHRRLLARHDHPGPTRGMCSAGGTHRALKRELIHPCARCAELPPRPDFLRDGTIAEQYRPAIPRPVTGGTLKLCATHRREHTAALKERAADAQRTRRFGVTKAEWRQLIAAQGGGCACGLTHATSKRRLAADHDHDREAECVRLGRHSAGQACKRCVRGGAGDQCNRTILGRFTSDQLRRLADYMDNPTAQRLGWWDDPTDDTDDNTDDDTEN